MFVSKEVEKIQDVIVVQPSTVKSLPLGPGSGFLKKEGREIKVSCGRVIKREGVVVLESFTNRNSVLVEEEIFPADTLVIDWEQEPRCLTCSAIIIRDNDGICEDPEMAL